MAKNVKRFFCIETTAISFVLIIVILIAGLLLYKCRISSKHGI